MLQPMSDEIITTEVLLRLIEELLEESKDDVRLASMLDEVNLFGQLLWSILMDSAQTTLRRW